MGATREIFHDTGKMLVSRDVLKSIAMEFSKIGKASFRKQLEIVPVPRLFEVVSLATASLMSLIIMGLNLKFGAELFFDIYLTIMSFSCLQYF